MTIARCQRGNHLCLRIKLTLFVMIDISILLACCPGVKLIISFNCKAWLFLHTFDDVNFGLQTFNLPTVTYLLCAQLQICPWVCSFWETAASCSRRRPTPSVGVFFVVVVVFNSMCPLSRNFWLDYVKSCLCVINLSSSLASCFWKLEVNTLTKHCALYAW